MSGEKRTSLLGRSDMLKPRPLFISLPQTRAKKSNLCTYSSILLCPACVILLDFLDSPFVLQRFEHLSRRIMEVNNIIWNDLFTATRAFNLLLGYLDTCIKKSQAMHESLDGSCACLP